MTPPASRSIMVIDDNPTNLKLATDVLEAAGYRVIGAADAEQAEARIHQAMPDLILMDIGLPRLNGLDATRQIRAQPWGQNIAIIALTGWGQENDREQSRQAGCNGHLVKPVEIAGLRSTLESLSKTKTN